MHDIKGSGMREGRSIFRWETHQKGSLCDLNLVRSGNDCSPLGANAIMDGATYQDDSSLNRSSHASLNLDARWILSRRVMGKNTVVESIITDVRKNLTIVFAISFVGSSSNKCR